MVFSVHGDLKGWNDIWRHCTNLHGEIVYRENVVAQGLVGY